MPERIDNSAKAKDKSGAGGFLRWMSVSIFCGAILLGTARRSAAATIQVTSNADSGVNTLRAAIAQATINQTNDIIDCTPLVPFKTTIALASPLTITNTTLTIISTS